MAGQVDVAKSTEAKFVPEDRKGAAQANSIEWMLMVTVSPFAASALGRSWSGWRSFRLILQRLFHPTGRSTVDFISAPARIAAL